MLKRATKSRHLTLSGAEEGSWKTALSDLSTDKQTEMPSFQ